MSSQGFGAPPYLGLGTSKIVLIHTYIHYITLHYITLHYITLHYITLHTYIHTCTRTYIYIYISMEESCPITVKSRLSMACMLSASCGGIGCCHEAGRRPWCGASENCAPRRCARGVTCVGSSTPEAIPAQFGEP